MSPTVVTPWVRHSCSPAIERRSVRGPGCLGRPVLGRATVAHHLCNPIRQWHPAVSQRSREEAELEMRVRIDESGQHGHIAEIDGGLPRQVLAHRHDAVAGDRHDAVAAAAAH